MNPQILVIYTGGTFGMQPTATGLTTSTQLLPMLRQAFTEEQRQALPAFDVIELPDLIDSSNLLPSMWSRIIETIASNAPRYQGFVVIHGTDTLAYTASLLSYVFNHVSNTLVVTGSQIPLLQPQSDAPSNFQHALVAATRPHKHVMVCFNQTLMPANRCTKVSASNVHAFDVPKLAMQAPSGTDKAPASDNKVPSFDDNAQQTHNVAAQAGKKPLKFDDHAVAIVHLYPGIVPELFHALNTDRCKAIVIQSFGMGNLPSNNTQVVAALKQLASVGKILVNITQCAHGSVEPGHYAAGFALDENSLINGRNLTVEAAFTKLHYLLALQLPVDEIKTLMQSALADDMDEITPQGKTE